MDQSSIVVMRWVARVWGTAAALLWGAFLIEHFAWFLSPGSLPPPRVWLLQGLHLTLVASLLAAWRFERAAGFLALVTSVLFFGAVAGSRFWPFLMTTVPPAVAFLYCGFVGARSRARN